MLITNITEIRWICANSVTVWEFRRCMRVRSQALFAIAGDSLEVRELRLSDSGYYTCLASNRYEAESTTTTIDVSKVGQCPKPSTYCLIMSSVSLRQTWTCLLHRASSSCVVSGQAPPSQLRADREIRLLRPPRLQKLLLQLVRQIGTIETSLDVPSTHLFVYKRRWFLCIF